MKKKSLLLAFLLIVSLAACKEREKNPPIDEETPSINAHKDEEKIEDIPKAPEESKPKKETSEKPEEYIVNDEPTEEQAIDALSGDYSELSDLDGKKNGWGPGLNVDEKNRPVDAMSFQEKYRHLGAYFIAPDNNKVYLTFDQGYENGYTAKILDVLKEKNVKAVFFLTGPYARQEKELVQRMIDEGHVLGNHSTKHLSFPDMDLQDAAADIMDLHDYVKSNYGYEMTLFRPPMGEYSEKTLALAQSLGYKSIFWSFAYKDWEVDNQPLTVEALATITGRAHSGAIYLLHSVSQTNAEVLGEAIDAIKEKGYEFSNDIAYF